MPDHPTGPPEGVLPLEEALRRFVPAELWRDYELAKENWPKRSQEPSYLSMSPREWLRRYEQQPSRTRSPAENALSSRSNPALVWHDIRCALIERLIIGELIGFAQDNPPFGVWRLISPTSWAALKIKDARKGHVTGPNIDLIGVHVMERPAEAVAPPATGAPGRPSSMHLIDDEFQSRIEAGQIESSLTEQARVLESWRKANYPDYPPATTKTIENKIRDLYNRARRRI